MFGLSLHRPLPFTFGVLGNLISLMVYLAPLPTFCRVYRKKSTEGFQSLPYVVALFSAMLWIYYAILKAEDTLLLITINALGCFIEGIYVIIYLIYAPRSAKIYTAKMIFLLNVATFGLIVILSLLLSKGHARITILGTICVGFSVCVFVAPLSIIRLVIRTRSVEFMPLSLSFFLTISAVVWFFYGWTIHDKFIAIPNVLGFVFGFIQMVLYACYRKARRDPVAVQEHCAAEHIVISIPRPSAEVHPIDPANADSELASDDGSDKTEAADAEVGTTTEVAAANQHRMVDRTINETGHVSS